MKLRHKMMSHLHIRLCVCNYFAHSFGCTELSTLLLPSAVLAQAVSFESYIVHHRHQYRNICHRRGCFRRHRSRRPHRSRHHCYMVVIEVFIIDRSCRHLRVFFSHRSSDKYGHDVSGSDVRAAPFPGAGIFYIQKRRKSQLRRRWQQSAGVKFAGNGAGNARQLVI